jgi:hypothetical protein
MHTPKEQEPQMNPERQPKLTQPEDMDTATRREFMKVAGLGALGMAYMHPVIDTMSHGRPDDPGQASVPGGPGGGGGSSSQESESSKSESSES